MKKTKLFGFTSLPALDDPKQRNAIKTASAFFATIFILGLISNGTSAATMPIVTLATPYQGVVDHSFSVDGTIGNSNGTPFEIPDGILVDDLFVNEGDQINVGDPIAALSKSDVDQSIKEQQANLEQLQIQSSQLSDDETADDFSVQQAQIQLDRANDEYSKANESGQKQVAEAEERMATARQKVEELIANETSQSSNSVATPEQSVFQQEYEKWQSEMNTAKSELTQAESELESAKSALESSLSAAQKNIQSMQDALDSALHSYGLQQEQTAQQNDTDKAKANVLAVQMDALEKELKELKNIQDENYIYVANTSGKITKLNLEIGQKTPEVAGLVADEDDGKIVSTTITTAQKEFVSVGTSVQVTQGNQSQSASVTEIQQTDGAYTVNIALGSTQLSDGKVTLNFSLQGSESGLCLPDTAINSDNEGSFVYIVDEQNTVMGIQNVLKRSAVTVEDSGNGVALVTGALSSEDQIVSGSTKPLSEGVKVRIDES